MDDMQENRSFPRVAASCRVEWRPVGDDPVFNEMNHGSGVMQNISGGGICMLVPKDPGVGTMLALDIDLPGFPTSVVALGKIVWSKSVEDQTEIGIEFWWIGWRDESAQAQIRSFIARKLREGTEVRT